MKVKSDPESTDCAHLTRRYGQRRTESCLHERWNGWLVVACCLFLLCFPSSLVAQDARALFESNWYCCLDGWNIAGCTPDYPPDQTLIRDGSWSDEYSSVEVRGLSWGEREFSASLTTSGSSATFVAESSVRHYVRSLILGGLIHAGGQSATIRVYVKGPPGTPYTLKVAANGATWIWASSGSAGATVVDAYGLLYGGVGSYSLYSDPVVTSGVTSDQYHRLDSRYTFAATLVYNFHAQSNYFAGNFDIESSADFEAQIDICGCPVDPDLDNTAWGWGGNNRCMDYAVNVDSPTLLSLFGGPPPRCYDVEDVRAAAVALGLIPSPTPSCDEGCLVALWAWPGCFEFKSWHFARQNSDGSWSEKSGKRGAVQIDPPDPEFRPLFWWWVGYFCVPCGWQPSSRAVVHRESVPENAIRVTPDSLSGDHDPYFDTDDPNLVALVHASLDSGEPQVPSIDIGYLGFSGFFVTPGDAVDGIPNPAFYHDNQVIYKVADELVAYEDVLGVGAYLYDLGMMEPSWGCLLQPPCLGDLDCSSAINLGDFAIFQANFGSTELAGFNTGDFDNDGDIDVADFGLFASEVGSTCGP